MGCENCANNGSGSPKGCRNNGSCATGGCSKLGVFDWLANISLPSGQRPYDVVEVRFKNNRKNFYRNTGDLQLVPGDVVVVEASPGQDVGVVSVVGELARLQVEKKSPNTKTHEFRRVYKKAAAEDIEKWKEARSLEEEAMFKARELAKTHGLAMKISDVEYQADKSKATFYYTAEERVDFRELIRSMASTFKVRIEMRQIGARQEAGRLGGIGSCGRELCCSTWLTDFRSVTTSAARYQQLSLNPQKLAGQCGKLKCCLNYELDQYIEAVKSFPDSGVKLKSQNGEAFHLKTDIFKKVMWYNYVTDEGGSMVPIPVDRVQEIISMNENGKKPLDFRSYALVEAPKEEKSYDFYSNVVGQDDLKRFDDQFGKKKKKNKRRKKSKGKGGNNPQNKGKGGGKGKGRGRKGGGKKGGNSGNNEAKKS